MILGLMVVGCGKTELTEEEKKALREKVVGTYEGMVQGDTYRLVFLANGIVQYFLNGKKLIVAKWSIVKEEIHTVGEDGLIGVSRINKDGSITGIARIEDGKREEASKEGQTTFFRIK